MNRQEKTLRKESRKSAEHGPVFFQNTAPDATSFTLSFFQNLETLAASIYVEGCRENKNSVWHLKNQCLKKNEHLLYSDNLKNFKLSTLVIFDSEKLCSLCFGEEIHVNADNIHYDIAGSNVVAYGTGTSQKDQLRKQNTKDVIAVLDLYKTQEFLINIKKEVNLETLQQLEQPYKKAQQLKSRVESMLLSTDISRVTFTTKEEIFMEALLADTEKILNELKAFMQKNKNIFKTAIYDSFKEKESQQESPGVLYGRCTHYSSWFLNPNLQPRFFTNGSYAKLKNYWKVICLILFLDDLEKEVKYVHTLEHFAIFMPEKTAMEVEKLFKKHVLNKKLDAVAEVKSISFYGKEICFDTLELASTLWEGNDFSLKEFPKALKAASLL